jgi:hypothetical protein
MARADGGRSRVTATLRLGVAVWLMATAVRTLADPEPTALEHPTLFGALLRVAAVSFTLGAFLLTGFLSRVCGMLLVALGAWQIVYLGFGIAPVVVAAIGVYLMLRGGGAWAMDIYVQKMQDRIRLRDANR